jgi:hypothetical protein
MIFDYSKARLHSLETLSQEFLGGFLPEGRAKIGLVAWNNIARPKLEGGLNLHTFSKQALVLKLRHVVKLLEGADMEWIWMAESIIKRALGKAPMKKDLKEWTRAEAILKKPDVQVQS